MKKLFFILVALIMVSAFIVTGCSTTSAPSTTAPPAKTSKPPATSAPVNSAPAKITAPATSAPATSTAPASVITLKFAYDMPATGSFSPGWNWFADQIQKQSNGRVKIDFYPGASLFTQTDTPDSLKAGVADIANIALSAHSQEFPINNIFVAPGMVFPDVTRDDYLTKYNAFLQLSQKYTALSSELSDYKVLFWCPGPAYRIISKKQITVPADLKGIKLAGSNMQGQITQLGGGVWVQAVPNQFYEGIEKGVYDGGYAPWSVVNTYKFEEVASYFLDYGFTQEIQMVSMNLKTWNSLPPDIQKLITDLVPETIARCSDSNIASAQKGIANAKAKNRTITTPTADQIALWDKLITPISDDWVKNAQSKGVTNAQDILNDLRSLRAAAMKNGT